MLKIRSTINVTTAYHKLWYAVVCVFLPIITYAQIFQKGNVFIYVEKGSRLTEAGIPQKDVKIYIVKGTVTTNLHKHTTAKIVTVSPVKKEKRMFAKDKKFSGSNLKIGTKGKNTPPTAQKRPLIKQFTTIPSDLSVVFPKSTHIFISLFSSNYKQDGLIIYDSAFSSECFKDKTQKPHNVQSTIQNSFKTKFRVRPPPVRSFLQSI